MVSQQDNSTEQSQSKPDLSNNNEKESEKSSTSKKSNDIDLEKSSTPKQSNDIEPEKNFPAGNINKVTKIKWFGPRPNTATVLVELVCLAVTTALIWIFNELIFPVGDVMIHGLPLIVTYVISYSIADVLNAIFNWFISKYIDDKKKLNQINHNENDLNFLKEVAAKCQQLGIYTLFERIYLLGKHICQFDRLIFISIIGIVAALPIFLNVIGFAISTTAPVPGLMPKYSKNLNIDPLTPCGDGNAACPTLLQDRFRFIWIQGASNVLINGITEQLSVNWGDDPKGERKVMVAVVDNDTTINYKFVKNDKDSIPVFSLSIICNTGDPPNFPGFKTPYHKLNIRNPINLTLGVNMDSWLENRWIAEVINLQQDKLNETTILNINLYNGYGGLNTDRVNYSSPRPVYGDYMHESLAIYGGHILIPQCIDNSVGCVNFNENNVSQVQKRFAELMYGITASGVMARRSLLSNDGTMINIQSVVKGTAGVIIKFEQGYYLTILIALCCCVLAFIFWLKYTVRKDDNYKYPVYKFNHKDQITCSWLLNSQTDGEKCRTCDFCDPKFGIDILIILIIFAAYGSIWWLLYSHSLYKLENIT
ncbi:hypothetical protein C2G38_2152809 [Gigaspora rosea]|uniref:Uncharacterized protein n=1 Tax=Gigaspora rosea TaxID=44941 RepID=A0A397W6M9_9GLOM|nr:hypothetical protein C2G38_2152809 [Gigaspora rosea]CAG8488477.1 8397_t:CDS:2 [Gigaspora rosea]